MSPLDRIAQLTAQLADAREQAARDSATIARLTAERQNWKEWAEEARAMFHKQIDALAILSARNETLVDLLTLALPSVEESEAFDKPSAPRLSEKIRNQLTA